MIKIIVDSEHFHTLSLDFLQYRRMLHPHIGDQRARQIAIHDLSLKEYWQPVDFILKEFDSNGETPDISSWSFLNLVFSQRAVDVLNQYLSNCGELLPLKSDQGNYYFFNCLRTVQPEQGDVVPAVFKSHQGENLGLFCSREFQEAVESAGLKGLLFTQDVTAL